VPLCRKSEREKALHEPRRCPGAATWSECAPSRVPYMHFAFVVLWPCRCKCLILLVAGARYIRQKQAILGDFIFAA
jgi:hypothetical protein